MKRYAVRITRAAQNEIYQAKSYPKTPENNSLILPCYMSKIRLTPDTKIRKA